MRIRALRKDKGLAPEQLAKDCHMKLIKLTRIEEGIVNVRLSTLVHLAQRFGITLDKLLQGL